MAQPLTTKQRKSSQGLVIQLAIIVLGLIAGYFYYTQYLRDNREPVIVTDIKINDDLSKFRELRTLDFKILTEPSFRILKIIGEAPVKPGPGGRTDIFAPF